MHVAYQLGGHTKDIIADAKTDAVGGVLLIVQTLKNVRLEDATVLMHRFEAAMTIECIALLALASGCTVAAFAAFGLQHDVIGHRGADERFI